MKRVIKKTFLLSTAYYTIAVMAFCAIMLLTHSEESDLSVAPSRIMYIYPFCLFFGLANVILRNTEWNGITRWILHFALTVSGAYFFIILPAELEFSSGNFMGLMIILALYMVGVMITLLFAKRIRSAIREDAEIKKRIKSK